LPNNALALMPFDHVWGVVQAAATEYNESLLDADRSGRGGRQRPITFYLQRG